MDSEARLSDQLSDDRLAHRRTPADVGGHSGPGCAQDGPAHRPANLASGRRGRCVRGPGVGTQDRDGFAILQVAVLVTNRLWSREPCRGLNPGNWCSMKTSPGLVGEGAYREGQVRG